MSIDVFDQGANFLIAIFLARFLGVESYGIYGYMVAWITLLANIGTLGFGHYLVREVAVARQAGAAAKIRGLIRLGLGASLAACSLVIAVAFVAQAFLVTEPDLPEATNAFRIGLLGVPAMATLLILVAILRGFGETTRARIVERVFRALFFLILLSAAWLWSGNTSPSASLAIGFYVSSLAAAVIILVQQLARFTDAWHRSEPSQLKPRREIIAALPFAMQIGLNLIVSECGMILIGLLGTPEEAGLFRVSSRLAMVQLLVFLAIMQPFASRIAALHAAGRQSELASLLWWASIPATMAAWGCLAAFALFGGGVLSLFGQAFTKAYPALLVMSSVIAIVPAAGFGGTVLAMTGRERLLLRSSAIAAIIGVGLCGALIPRFGAVGAAIGWALALLAMHLGAGWLAYRASGIPAGWLFGRTVVARS